MLSRIRASRPEARIAMLVRHYPGELLSGHPDIDDLLWYDTPEGVPLPFERLKEDLRAASFDTAIVVHPTPRLAWLMFRAKIPVRVGTGYRVYSPLFTRKIFEHRRRGDRHELACNFGLLRPLGIPSDPPGLDVQFRLAIPEDARSRVREKLAALGLRSDRPLAVVHPGSGGSSRDWPSAKFGSLVRELAGHGMTVVVTGSAGERALTEQVAAAAAGDARSVAGMFTLQELAALLGTAALFVGNSSGPLHLAVAMRTPVVGLYPRIPEIGPGRWGPYASDATVIVPDRPASCKECSGRGRRPCACMESIETGRVVSACLDLIRRTTMSAGGSR